MKIEKPEDYFLSEPEDDPQVKIQQERESKILSKIYFHEENVPKNPSMESMIKFDTRSKMIVKGSSLKKTYQLYMNSKKGDNKSEVKPNELSQFEETSLNFLSQEFNIENKNEYNLAQFSTQNAVSSLEEINHSFGQKHSNSQEGDASILSEESIQQITYLKGLSQNYRTIPCKNYHGSQKCGRSRYCHFIHLAEYEGIKFILIRSLSEFYVLNLSLLSHY